MPQENLSTTTERRKPRRSQLLMRVGALTAGLALFAGASAEPRSAEAQALDASSPQIVGITADEILTDNPEGADQAAQQLEDMGANAVRFFFPYNKTTAWIGNYGDMICNAVKAAQSHGLRPIISFEGHATDSKGQDTPFIPQTPHDIRKFGTTVDSIIWTLASDPTDSQPGGCVPDLQEIDFEIFNEVNNPSIAGQETPQQYVQLLSKVYKTANQEASKPTINTKVVIYAGALAAANHDPVSYLDQMGQAKQAGNLGRIADVIEVHPYPKDSTADPAQTMMALYPGIMKDINTYFPGSLLFWGEIGIPTLPPNAAKKALYSVTAPGVNESQQAQYVSDIAMAAACEPGVDGFTLFHRQDSGSDNTPTGEFYPDGSPKTSLKKISNTLYLASLGSLTNCDN